MKAGSRHQRVKRKAGGRHQSAGSEYRRCTPPPKREEIAKAGGRHHQIESIYYCHTTIATIAVYIYELCFCAIAP